MENIFDLNNEKDSLKNELDTLFNTIREHTVLLPTSLIEQINFLKQFRLEIYENINQLQHKALVINAVVYLQEKFPMINKWICHPKQTSKIDEADINGFSNSKIIVKAEVTTSLKPIGIIDTRMKNILISLSKNGGEKYYFVQTEEMYNRANIKIKKMNLNIEVRLL